MATKAEVSRALTYDALRLFHTNQPCIPQVAMAKLLTQRSALEIADQTLQIHGGYGYTREYGIERAVRDARLGPIGGGTDEVMKEIIGKTLGLLTGAVRSPYTDDGIAMVDICQRRYESTADDVGQREIELALDVIIYAELTRSELILVAPSSTSMRHLQWWQPDS